jgi:hypothetical protein
VEIGSILKIKTLTETGLLSASAEKLESVYPEFEKARIYEIFRRGQVAKHMLGGFFMNRCGLRENFERREIA